MNQIAIRIFRLFAALYVSKIYAEFPAEKVVTFCNNEFAIAMIVSIGCISFECGWAKYKPIDENKKVSIFYS